MGLWPAGLHTGAAQQPSRCDGAQGGAPWTAPAEEHSPNRADYGAVYKPGQAWGAGAGTAS